VRAAIKAFIVRFWPVLRLRTILFGVLLFVAALPGFSAIFLRVYENALVRRTEAELIAQSAAIAAGAAIIWPGAKTSAVVAVTPVPDQATTGWSSYDNSRVSPADKEMGVVDISTEIDLRTSPILPERPKPAPLKAPPNADAKRVATLISPAIEETKKVTLSSILLLDNRGAILNDPNRTGSYGDLPEVRQALKGKAQTMMRLNTTYYRQTLLEVFSQAATIRLHHARPITVNGRVVGVVLVSRSPRALLRGMYEDRGKIAVGVAGIFVLLIGLSMVLGRAIVRPLESLSAASRSLAKGQREAPKGSSLQVVEIKTLYHDFDVMAESIDQRSRYLRDFAASVSHEFKTPLAGLRGGIELLQDHGTTMSADERATFLANMDADTKRLSHLVSRLLDLARADMAAIDQDAACDVGHAMAVARDSLAGPALEIVIGPLPRPSKAAIDGPTLESVLVTILENARQAGARRVEMIAKIVGPTISIHVINNGPPIPEADQERIFEPFFTSKRAQGGTGIGLSIARSLLRGYGGGLELATNTDGVTFVLEMRRAKEARARPVR
jgi:signal transduction histidine kinase